MPHRPVAPSLIRAAMWRAARAGLEGDLVDLRERRPLPVQQVVRRLVDDLRPQLEEAGDWEHGAPPRRRGAARQAAAPLGSGPPSACARSSPTSSTCCCWKPAAPISSRIPHPPRSADARRPVRAAQGRRGIRRQSPAAQGIRAGAARRSRASPRRMLEARERDRDRHQTEREVTFTVDGETRPFPIDLVPRLIEQSAVAPARSAGSSSGRSPSRPSCTTSTARAVACGPGCCRRACWTPPRACARPVRWSRPARCARTSSAPTWSATRSGRLAGARGQPAGAVGARVRDARPRPAGDRHAGAASARRDAGRPTMRPPGSRTRCARPPGARRRRAARRADQRHRRFGLVGAQDAGRTG